MNQEGKNRGGRLLSLKSSSEKMGGDREGGEEGDSSHSPMRRRGKDSGKEGDLEKKMFKGSSEQVGTRRHER